MIRFRTEFWFLAHRVDCRRHPGHGGRAGPVPSKTDPEAGHARQIAGRLRRSADRYHKSRWFYFSSACRPFGMVNLSPDTRTGDDWMHGYLYGDTKIRCFSHIHGWQLYGIAVLPVTGEVPKPWDMDACAADFSNEDEVIHPGYHKVVLKNYGITAELTSTTPRRLPSLPVPQGSMPKVILNTGATLMAPITSSEIHRRRPDGPVRAGRDGPHAAAAQTVHRVLLRRVRPADRKVRRLGRKQAACRIRVEEG